MIKKIIIIDTNALMAISSFKIDLFGQIDIACDFPYKVHILEGTVQELHKIIEEQRGKYKQAAKLALGIIKAMGISQLPSDKYVDDVLVEHSHKGAIIVTQDAALKKRLSKPYMTIRQKKKLIIVK